MPHSRIVQLLAVGLLWSSYAFAQQPTTTTQTQETPTTGSIVGRVVNESGAPVAGAVVYIRGMGFVGTGRVTATDSEGNFQVNNLDPSLYFINAQLPAFITTPRDPNAPPIYYRVGDNVRLELIRGGVITGTVTNSAGEPIVAVRVRAYMIRDSQGKAVKVGQLGFGERNTDDRGIYRIYGLSPGTYVVYTAGGGPNYAYGPYDNDAPTFAPSATRDNAAEIVVRSGEDSTADIRHRGEAGRTISGTVKGVVPQGANIILTRIGEGTIPISSVFQAQDARGFAFYGIGDGEYDAVAIGVQAPFGPGVTSVDVAMSEPRRIMVKGADISGLELLLKPLASLSGQIILEPSKVQECQGKRRPLLSEMTVDVKRNLKNQEEETGPQIRAYTGPTLPGKDGTFTARNLREGQYSINPRFYARYWYLQSMSLGPQASSTTGPRAPQTTIKSDVARNWANVKAGDRITGLAITIAEGAASIKGLITLAEGAKRPEKLNVYLVPAEREKADDVLRFFVTESDTEGNFTLPNLPPGRYRLVSMTPTDPELAPDKLRLPTASESRLKLRRAAEAGKAEIELKPCQNVTDYKLPG